MRSEKIQPKNVDEYISGHPEEIQKKLQALRIAIRKEAPEATEIISYKMPAYLLNGILVYFAVCKNHIGFYPTASGIENFEKELSKYEASKGTVKFHLAHPLPLDLIRKIVKFRVKENLQKQKNQR